MVTRRTFMRYLLGSAAFLGLSAKLPAASSPSSSYKKLPGDDRFVVVDGWVLLASDLESGQ